LLRAQQPKNELKHACNSQSDSSWPSVGSAPDEFDLEFEKMCDEDIHEDGASRIPNLPGDVDFEMD
jgi:hypothetical protein